MVSYPFWGKFALVAILLNAIAVILGIYAVSDSRRTIQWGIALVVVSSVYSVAAALSGNDLLLDLNFLLIALLHTYTLSCFIRYTLRKSAVDADKLYAGIIVYITIGLICTPLYTLMHQINPHSFSFFNSETSGSIDFVYFSFITLAGVGYGDITPVAPYARSLAVMEGMSGVLYVSVLIARLVSLYEKHPEV